jgi:hypothetical protein
MLRSLSSALLIAPILAAGWLLANPAAAAQCNASSAWVPTGSPFEGHMYCPDECGGTEDSCVQIVTFLPGDLVRGHCGCSDGTQPEPSPCCSLVMWGNLAENTVWPTYGGACGGGSCPGSGTCRLFAHTSTEWDPDTEKWVTLGIWYQAACA